MISLLALVAGTSLGTGLVLALLATLRPAPLDVAAAWQHLSTRTCATPIPAGWHGHTQHLLARAEHLQHPWLGLPTSDLELLELTPADYLTRRLRGACGGLATGALAGVGLYAMGLGVPVVVLGVLTTTAGGALLPVFTVREAAASVREEYRRALAAYLDLIAQERTAGRAPTHALREAAAVGEHPLFLRVHATLAHAHRIGQTPWHALREIGQRLDVVELVDVADLAETAADGAAVYASLTTKAAALRTAAVTTDKAEANARSERLTLPTSLLMLGFLLLVLYPTAAHLLAI